MVNAFINTLFIHCLITEACLIRILPGVLHDGHQGQPGLLSSGDDLIGRQDETIAASVSQLKGVGVLDALVVGQSIVPPLAWSVDREIVRRVPNWYELKLIFSNLQMVVMMLPYV